MKASLSVVSVSLLIITGLLCISQIYIAGSSSSAGPIGSGGGRYAMGALFSAIFLFATFLIWKKRAALVLSSILLAITLFVSLVNLSVLNCARCVPQDSRNLQALFRVQDAINAYFKTNGEYPTAPQRLDEGDVTRSSLPLTYSRTGESYQVCVQQRVRSFYGFVTDAGQPFCIGPKDCDLPSSERQSCILTRAYP